MGRNLKHKENYNIPPEVYLGAFYNKKEMDTKIFEFPYAINQDSQGKKMLPEKQFADLIIDSIPGLFYVIDANGQIIRANDILVELLEYTHDELLKTNAVDLVIEEERELVSASIREVFDKGKSSIKSKLQAKSGKVYDFNFNGRRFEDNGQYFIVGTGINITEQQQHQQQREALIKEKTSLLAEIHHRVKNNLALITGLIELQVEESGNPELRKQLNDIRKRILTIASVHEVLYKTGDLSEIPFREYSVQLAENSITINEVCEEKVSISVAFDELALDINQALPAGLFLNELLGIIFAVSECAEKLNLHISCIEKNGCVHIFVECAQLYKYIDDIKNDKSLSSVLRQTLITQLQAKFYWPDENEDNSTIELTFKKESLSNM